MKRNCYPCYFCWVVMAIMLVIATNTSLHAQPINAVGPAQVYTPGLIINSNTHILHPMDMFPDVMQVRDNHNNIQMRVKMDGGIALYNGARITFDGSKLYTKAGPKIGYVEVYVSSGIDHNDVRALLPIYLPPDGD